MIHNQLTNYAQLLAGFRRMLGEMGGEFSGIERAGETLTPVMDLWALPEWALLRGETIFSRVALSPAVAARLSSVELVNPAASGILAVVLELALTGAADVQVSVDSGVAIAANPVVSQGVANDTRWPQLGETSRCTLTTGDVAGGIALPQDHITPTLRSIRPYIIRPGTKLMAICGTVNTATRYNFLWTERPLLPNEQNP